MYAKKKEKVIKKIINTNEMNYKMDNIFPGMEGDEISQEEGQLIINYEEDDGEVQNTNYRYYQQDLNNNNQNQKNVQNMKKQIYTKVRSDSYNKPFAKKVNISKYIYKTQRNFNAPKGNITTDFIRFNNNSKYFIKNPVKEKSRNKINKNQSSNNFYVTRNNKRNIINTNNINNLGNNTDIIDENYNYIGINGENEDFGNINNTNYYFRPKINMEMEMGINNNNTEYIQNETPIYVNINKNKGGNINLNPQKRQFVSANRRINYYNKNENKDEPSPRESRISYIYDYSQENNKNSYYVESPHNIKYISAYPLKIKKKNLNKNKTDFIKLNNKNRKTNNVNDNDRLKKLIEESKRKFDNIRQIEKKIKNYFNLNGLNIENRELYDQSATMIQSAFRAYSSRLHLYKEINLFVNISLLNDLLKKIFLSRKKLYWETFSQNAKNYIPDKIIDTISSNNNNNNKIVYTKNNSMKKMPISYNKKNNIKNNNMLLPQLITSFNYIGNNENENFNLDSEEMIKKLKIENDELKKNYEILKEQYEKITNNKNNIVKDTQASVDLKLGGDGVNIDLINSANENKDLLKLSKLKYITKNKALKTKENLHKYFLKMYYNALLLSKNIDKNKTDEDIKDEKIETEKYKKLRNLITKKEKDIKNIIRNKYMIYYFKGKINEMQTNNNNINNDDNDKKDLINNDSHIENIENEKNKDNIQNENENEKNENNI